MKPPRPPPAPPARHVLGWVLGGIASVGFFVISRLGPRLLEGPASWLGGIPPLPRLDLNVVNVRHTLLPVERMFLESAWLWPLLAGVVLLGSAEKELAVGQSPRQRWQVALALLLLVGALGVGLRGRGTPFWEAEQSLQQNVVSDESVYVSGARVWLQGHLPYRDFWLAHPPTGIAMLLPAAALGETAPEALLAARRTTALLDLCTALLIAWVAFRLGGLASAVIAAGLYLLDGIVAHHSALAFLETGLTFWSVAALGCALQGLHQDRPRWLVAAGALAALAASIKYTGSSLLVALLLVLVTTRRWRMVRALLLGSGAVGLLLALALLPLGWGNILRQTLLIHLLRPPAGIPSPERFMVAFNHVASVPTVLVGTLGVFALLFPRRLQHPGWAIVLFWLAFMLALFSRSHVFYGYYVPPLMAPLALLGGATYAFWGPQRWRRGAVLAVALGILLPFVLLQQTSLFKPGLFLEEAQSRRPWGEVATLIQAHVPAGQPVLARSLSFNVVADRPPARAPDGRLLIDPLLHPTALVARLEERSVEELWRALTQEQARASLLTATGAYPWDAMMQTAPAVVIPNQELSSLHPRLEQILDTEFRWYPSSSAMLFVRQK